MTLALLVALALGARPAAAQDCETTHPAPGATIDECVAGAHAWAVARVDLSVAGRALRVARPDRRGERISDWIDAAAVLGAQAGEFRFPDYRPRGLTVGSGRTWEGTVDDGGLSVLAFDEGGASLFVPPAQVVEVAPFMHDVLSGVPLVEAGEVIRPCRDDGCELRPRTGVGISRDGRFLVVVAERGYRPGDPGVDDVALGARLVGAGAWDGLRAGSGATSSLWSAPGREDPFVVPSSDGGGGRAAAAWLAVTDAAPETVRVFGTVLVSGGEERLAGAEVELRSLDGEVVESGLADAEAAFGWDVPRRDYVVVARAPGHEGRCRYCDPADVSEAGELSCAVFLVPGDAELPVDCVAVGRRVEAGPWPLAPPDAGSPDAGPDTVAPPVESGCAVAPGRGARVGFSLAALWAMIGARVRRRDQ